MPIFKKNHVECECGHRFKDGDKVFCEQCLLHENASALRYRAEVSDLVTHKKICPGCTSPAVSLRRYQREYDMLYSFFCNDCCMESAKIELTELLNLWVPPVVKKNSPEPKPSEHDDNSLFRFCPNHGIRTAIHALFHTDETTVNHHYQINQDIHYLCLHLEYKTGISCDVFETLIRESK